MAKRMVKKFGEDTLKVIEEDSEKLQDVEGVGSKRVTMIAKAWADQKEIREVMLFLQSHGVSSTYAAKIYKQYGQQSIDEVKENPYGFVKSSNPLQLCFANPRKLRSDLGQALAFSFRVILVKASLLNGCHRHHG